MRFFDRFRKRKESNPRESDNPNDVFSGFNPKAHHVVLEYLRQLWNGKKPDASFEQKTLNRDLNFNSINLAELIFAISKERDIPRERILHFLRIGIPGGGDQMLATLLERTMILADGGLAEPERMALLWTGVVGDRKELTPIAPMFDRVAFIVKYCRAIELVKEWKDHDAIELDYGEVEEDPGWK